MIILKLSLLCYINNMWLHTRLSALYRTALKFTCTVHLTSPTFICVYERRSRHNSEKNAHKKTCIEHMRLEHDNAQEIDFNKYKSGSWMTISNVLHHTCIWQSSFENCGKKLYLNPIYHPLLKSIYYSTHMCKG